MLPLHPARKDNDMTTQELQKLTKEEQRLISFLPAGAERPRSQSELAALLYGNASNENKRKVRKLVNQSILDGAPVGSLHRSYNAGYFLITNEDERLAALQTLRTQSSSLIKRADKLRRTALWTN